jgi:hypothetical protein
MSTEEETRLKAMRTVLGEPFGLEYREDVLKTRRNLLAAGAISVLICSADLTVQTGVGGGTVAPILGWSLTGMKQSVLLWCLTVMTAYLLLHFVWASVDAIHEYALRSTGLPVEGQYGDAAWGPEGVEPTNDARQTTLYSWWQYHARSVEPLAAKLHEQGATLDRYLGALGSYKENPSASDHQRDDILRNATIVQQAQVNLMQSVKQLRETFSNPRVQVSLERFDVVFRRRALSQNARWIVLEFGFPVVLGIAGILGALNGLFPRWWACCG